MMTREEFLTKVQERGGFEGRDAEQIARAVLSALGEVLTADERASLAAHVPEPVARLLGPGAGARASGLDGLVARVAERTGLSRSHALEAALVVCRALVADLAAEERERLAAHLGPALGRLFEVPGEGGEPERSFRIPAEPPPGEGRTLATGRPGSRHPLSDARPETAHAESVARSDDPHADSKLSSAHGLTQEALHESLADGKPGPKRNLADTRD